MEGFKRSVAILCSTELLENWSFELANSAGRKLGKKELTSQMVSVFPCSAFQKCFDLKGNGIWTQKFRLKIIIALDFLFMKKVVLPVGKPRYRWWSPLKSCLYYMELRPHVCAKSLQSYLTLCDVLWTVACQAPLSMGFSRQEYWSGVPCPPLSDLDQTPVGRVLYH